MKETRNEILEGVTKRIVIEDRRVYLTINDQDGHPFEIFIRADRPELYEWITLVTVLITRLLRSGESLLTIAQEMQIIHSSAQTNHFLPDGSQCASLVAHIGQELEKHARLKSGQGDLFAVDATLD